ncbi:MAG TPA: hypothetical protein VGN04_00455 [Herbaspirillum sp.]|jgi:type IV secretory pathway VirB10-like protein
MISFNPISVRAFVGHSQLQRRTRTRFRVATGILLSVLLHAAFLWYALSVPPRPPLGASSPVPAPLMVTLLKNTQKAPSADAPSPLPPEPVRSNTPPKPKPQKAIKRSAPKAVKPNTPPLPQAPSAMRAPPAADMSAMLDAARARRQASQDASASDNAISRDSGKAPSGNEVAQANVDFSLRKNKGISGVFEVLSVGPRIGIFRFIGWTADASDNTRQTITVDAGSGGDVEQAIIKRMIQLIREHYKENFNWDSQRLGRIVVLSAREKDEADLRRFMTAEFFERPRY